MFRGLCFEVPVQWRKMGLESGRAYLLSMDVFRGDGDKGISYLFES
jgi:hypothetical protein